MAPWARQAGKVTVGGSVFALVAGLVVAWISYSWITDPGGREQRAREEAVVNVATSALRRRLGGGDDLVVVDPLNPNRVAGKTYIYPVEAGWEVSGHYRRGSDGPWQPWLITLDANAEVTDISVR